MNTFIHICGTRTLYIHSTAVLSITSCNAPLHVVIAHMKTRNPGRQRRNTKDTISHEKGNSKDSKRHDITVRLRSIRNFPDHATFCGNGANLACLEKLGLTSPKLYNEANFDPL